MAGVCVRVSLAPSLKIGSLLWPDQAVVYITYSAGMAGMLGYAFCYDVWCYELGVLCYRLAAFCCLQLLCQCTRICDSTCLDTFLVVCITACMQNAHVQCLNQHKFAD